MLAPHRLFNSVLDLVENKMNADITQHLLDTMNKTIEKMVDVYCIQYGYARPVFEVVFHLDTPHTVAIMGKNDYAIRIIEEYHDYVGTPD